MTVTERGAAGRDAAAARGEAARRRAGQLQQRRAELASGLPSDAETAERARTHALESMERAKRAHRDAAEVHRAAAAQHEAAAIVQAELEQLSGQD